MSAFPAHLLAIPLVAAATLAGLWVSGALITNDFGVSMWLTVAWMTLAGLACLAVALRRRSWRWSVLGGYALASIVAGALLAPSVLFDDVVHEDVAMAAPAAPASTSSPSSVPAHDVLVQAGRFESVRHGARGVAQVIRLANGRRVLTLTGFSVANGPDLRVYLVRGPARSEDEVDDVVDLGALKGNRGDQQYRLPAGADLRGTHTVVVWCRAFSVLFARAELR